MLTEILSNSLFLLSIYPILGAILWSVGALLFRFVYRFAEEETTYLSPSEQPFVTILVPAHNEEVMIEETLHYLLDQLNYDNYEVLVMDDASTDKTPEILHRLQKHYPRLRVIRIEKNKGKAHAFNVGIAFAKGRFILSNDADTVPEVDAIHKYMAYFMRPSGHNIAAVTANMDVQNRSRIIEKSQTVEFSSIVGVIKRSQMALFGGMYAYSGANTMYRREAIFDVGLFRQDRATEDISICWDHQLSGWQAVFAPSILFYMNVPSNLRQLYRQRRRWAKGGTEVWLTNFWRLVKNPFKNFKRILMLIDQTLSIIWAFFYYITKLIYWFSLIYFICLGEYRSAGQLFLMSMVLIGCQMIAGLSQILVALFIDNKGAKLKYLFFAPFYLLLYWRMNALTIVTTFVPALKTILGYGVGTWKSPERKALGE